MFCKLSTRALLKRNTTATAQVDPKTVIGGMTECNLQPCLGVCVCVCACVHAHCVCVCVRMCKCACTGRSFSVLHLKQRSFSG